MKSYCYYYHDVNKSFIFNYTALSPPPPPQIHQYTEAARAKFVKKPLENVE